MFNLIWNFKIDNHILFLISMWYEISSIINDNTWLEESVNIDNIDFNLIWNWYSCKLII